MPFLAATLSASRHHYTGARRSRLHEQDRTANVRCRVRRHSDVRGYLVE